MLGLDIVAEHVVGLSPKPLLVIICHILCHQVRRAQQSMVLIWHRDSSSP